MDGNANAVSALHIFTVNVEQKISLNFQKKLSAKLALLRKLVKMQICPLFMWCYPVRLPGRWNLNLEPNSSSSRLKNWIFYLCSMRLAVRHICYKMNSHLILKIHSSRKIHLFRQTPQWSKIEKFVFLRSASVPSDVIVVVLCIHRIKKREAS